MNSEMAFWGRDLVALALSLVPDLPLVTRLILKHRLPLVTRLQLRTKEFKSKHYFSPYISIRKRLVLRSQLFCSWVPFVNVWDYASLWSAGEPLFVLRARMRSRQSPLISSKLGLYAACPLKKESMYKINRTCNNYCGCTLHEQA